MILAMRLRYALLACGLALLAACKQSPSPTAYDGNTTNSETNSATGAPQRASLPDPTTMDAVNTVVNSRGAVVVYHPAGPVTGCVDGRDAGGRLVRTCNACMVLLRLDRPHPSLSLHYELERSIFNISFRRAISTNQPDIAPMDEASGVWVGISVPTAQFPRSSILFSSPLSSSTMRPLGLNFDEGISSTGNVCVSPRPGYTQCGPPNSQPVVAILTSPRGQQFMASIAGSCAQAS